MRKKKEHSFHGKILVAAVCIIIANAALTSVSAPLTAASQLGVSSFTTIQQSVKKTLYQTLSYNVRKASAKTLYDLNGDGKKETVAFSYKGNPDESTAEVRLTVGSSTAILKPLYFNGVYLVNLAKSDKYIEIAVQVASEDDDVYTDFYRYDGKLVKLGEVYGCIADNTKGMLFSEYNSGILSDGKGNLIPRYGAIQFVSPQILRDYLTLRGNKFVDVKPNLSGALNKTYTVTGNSTPFFEPMSAISKNYMTRCQPSDQISLKKGEKITIKSISSDFGNMYCMLVQLPNKKTGALYYFLHP